MKRISHYLIALFALAVLAPSRASAELGFTERRIAEFVDITIEEEIRFFERVVNINSGTMNHEGVRKVGEAYAEAFRALGMKTEWVDLPKEMNRAGHLIASQEGDGKGKRVVLIGHLDTVFEADSPFQKFRREGVKAFGPGTEDMKGGNTVILYALKALKAAGALGPLGVTVILNGDEEKHGHPVPVTRARLIEAAKNSDVALAFEGGVKHMHTATIARRGYSGWTLRVRGKRGHGSQIFGEKYGNGAVYEAARILDAFRTELASLPDLTYNPGLILGGTEVDHDPDRSRGTVFGKSNVIAQEVVVAGELRALSPGIDVKAKALMKDIAAKNLSGTSAELEFEEGYPPMAPTPGNKALFNRLDEVSRDLGLGKMEMVDPMARGAADVSFASVFIPSLDGLGLAGGGGHSTEEWADLRSMAATTKRTAVLLYRLSRHPRKQSL